MNKSLPKLSLLLVAAFIVASAAQVTALYMGLHGLLAIFSGNALLAVLIGVALHFANKPK